MRSENMQDDIREVLLSREEIAALVSKLGAQISRDYAGKNPLLVCILKGSSIFTADLLRAITIPCEVDFMAVSSYGSGTESSGKVNIKKDLTQDIAGRHVLLVEDILDSGVTMSILRPLLEQRKPASLALCALCDKPERRTAQVSLEYCGTHVPNEFIVGYGLDYDEHYRNLPDICVLKPEIYAD